MRPALPLPGLSKPGRLTYFSAPITPVCGTIHDIEADRVNDTEKNLSSVGREWLISRPIVPATAESLKLILDGVSRSGGPGFAICEPLL